MKNRSIIKVCLGFLFIFFSCQKEENAAPMAVIDPTMEYFPIDSGLTRFYNVDSIYWDEFTGTNDTVSYSLKEVNAGTFIDNEGRLAQRVERFRKDAVGNWVIYKVWTSHRNNLRAEKVQDNIRIVKLVFPATNGVDWNGNAYNTLTEQKFEFFQVGQPGSINNLNFPETVSVLEDDEPANLLNDRYAEERYAKNVGCYYQLISDLEFNFLNGDTVSGYIYSEKLTSYLP